MATHRERILDQFTRQARPFSEAPGIRDEAALRLLVAASGAGADDTVLDVACGPGLVVAAFARVTRHATGIDVTPAMLARARELTAGLPNVTFDQGDAVPLPYGDATFSIVVSRFAFHHFPDPGAVLGEMRRVCRPGGRVVVCDLVGSPDPEKAAAFHRLEVLRDPSHVRAIPEAELIALFQGASLPPSGIERYRLPFELEGMLARSFPSPDDVPTIRAAYESSIDGDTLGLGTRRVGTEVHAAYPVTVLVARR